MDLSKIFKKLDLISLEDTQVTKLENDLVNNVKEILLFLRHLTKFLSLYKGKEYELVMAKDLAEISSDPENNKDSTSCIVFDFKSGFQQFRSALPEHVDINYSIFELFSNCLFYIISLIHNEPDDVNDIYEHFVNIRCCIQIFSETSIILDTKRFKNIVSVFIASLMKVLTSSEFSIKRTNLLPVCNLIRRILSDLSKIMTYRDLILRQIIKRIKCALSYSKVNETFDGYIASQTFVFEHFLWIMRTTLDDCYDLGSNVDDKLIFEMKEVLEDVKKCLESKVSFVVMKRLENILLVL